MCHEPCIAPALFFTGKISPKNVKILKIEVILEVVFNYQKVREKKIVKIVTYFYTFHFKCIAKNKERMTNDVYFKRVVKTRVPLWWTR